MIAILYVDHEARWTHRDALAFVLAAQAVHFKSPRLSERYVCSDSPVMVLSISQAVNENVLLKDRGSGKSLNRRHHCMRKIVSSQNIFMPKTPERQTNVLPEGQCKV
ncbi:hypothetical protein [Microvirga tunisiensis]|uniref:hypothetical protein n=1 Tax=Microvirga tunisiensis TaxID=2108360 RepID=UPI00128B0DC7|nr:hypothetical protein [Microvirga tunisiensis]MPR12457.1 hypothetical protein [Microvirga tunisiensis]